MDWTIADHRHANHPPVVEVNGHTGTAPVSIDAQARQPLLLDASRSHDLDGNHLQYRWFHYSEAGGTGESLAPGNGAHFSLR